MASAECRDRRGSGGECGGGGGGGDGESANGGRRAHLIEAVEAVEQREVVGARAERRVPTKPIDEPIAVWCEQISADEQISATHLEYSAVHVHPVELFFALVSLSALQCSVLTTSQLHTAASHQTATERILTSGRVKHEESEDEMRREEMLFPIPTRLTPTMICPLQWRWTYRTAPHRTAHLPNDQSAGSQHQRISTRESNRIESNEETQHSVGKTRGTRNESAAALHRSAALRCVLCCCVVRVPSGSLVPIESTLSFFSLLTAPSIQLISLRVQLGVLLVLVLVLILILNSRHTSARQVMGRDGTGRHRMGWDGMGGTKRERRRHGTAMDGTGRDETSYGHKRGSKEQYLHRSSICALMMQMQCRRRAVNDWVLLLQSINQRHQSMRCTHTSTCSRWSPQRKLSQKGGGERKKRDTAGDYLETELRRRESSIAQRRASFTVT